MYIDIKQVEKWYYTYLLHMFNLEEPTYDAYGGWHFNIISKNEIIIPFKTYAL